MMSGDLPNHTLNQKSSDYQVENLLIAAQGNKQRRLCGANYLRKTVIDKNIYAIAFYKPAIQPESFNKSIFFNKESFIFPAANR